MERDRHSVSTYGETSAATPVLRVEGGIVFGEVGIVAWQEVSCVVCMVSGECQSAYERQHTSYDT